MGGSLELPCGYPPRALPAGFSPERMFSAACGCGKPGGGDWLPVSPEASATEERSWQRSMPLFLVDCSRYFHAGLATAEKGAGGWAYKKGGRPRRVEEGDPRPAASHWRVGKSEGHFERRASTMRRCVMGRVCAHDLSHVSMPAPSSTRAKGSTHPSTRDFRSKDEVATAREGAVVRGGDDDVTS